jgi:hypothetical protein
VQKPVISNPLVALNPNDLELYDDEDEDDDWLFMDDAAV